MAVLVEVLRGKTPPPTGEVMLHALTDALRRCGDSFVETEDYRGDSPWLMLFGVGAPKHYAARDLHVASGRRVMLWDLGYFGRQKLTGYCRGSLDHDHPQAWLDKAPQDGTRWAAHGLRLREDYKPDGHIVLVGLGRKGRVYHGEGWEERKYAELVQRFPDRRIVYRPKRHSDPLVLPCKRAADGQIQDVLRGASLVVCRHSNVAVDAVVAGVPFEAEDGAAMWLVGKEWNKANRLDFLQRLAWFQWRPDEAARGWAFFKGVACV